MDKLKNIFSPGHQHDDEVLYGSGQSDDPVVSGNPAGHTGKLTGQGSHLESALTRKEPGSTTGTDSTATGNAASHILSPQQVHQDDAESTASIKSGVEGLPQSASKLTSDPGMHSGLETYPRQETSTSSPAGLHSSSDPRYQTEQSGPGGYGGNTETTGAGGENFGQSTAADRQGGIAHIEDTVTDRSYPIGGQSHGTKNEPSMTGNQLGSRGEDHHYGRDAAMGGGAGAAGLGSYEATRDKPSSTDPSYTSRPTGDRAVGSDTVGQGYGTRESTQPSSDSHPPLRMPGGFDDSEQPTDTTGKEHHYGRDAGLAGAGVGAGAYGAGKYGDNSTSQGTTDQPTVTSGTAASTVPQQSAPSRQPDSTTYGKPGFDSGTDSKTADFSSTDNAPRSTVQDPSSGGGNEHHYGRDAGIAAGADGLGVGAYDHQKPAETGKPLPNLPDRTQPAPSSAYEQPGLLHRDVSNPQTAPTSTEQTRPEEKGPHYGRDAGVAATGLGAVGYGTHEHEKHETEDGSREEEARMKAAAKAEKKHEKALDKEERREEKAHEKAIAKEEKRYEKEHGAMLATQEKERRQPQEEISGQDTKEKKGLLGFLHGGRNKDTGDQGLEPDYRDSHRKEEALGAAGVVGAGGAAYEHEKHHRGEHNTPDSTTTGDYRDPLHQKETSSYPSHHGTEAAVGTGTVGAGAYEADKHMHRDTYDQPSSTGVYTQPSATQGTNNQSAAQRRADELMGTDPQAKQHDSHHGAEAATGVGVAGLGAYEADKHLHKDTTSGQHGTTGGHDQQSSTVGSNDPSNTVRGKDGILRVIQPGDNNSYDQSTHSPGTTRGTDSYGTEQSRSTHDSHLGAETAAGVGGLGALGVGASEADKHMDKKAYDQSSGPPTSTYNQSSVPSGTRGTDQYDNESPRDTHGSHRGAETTAGAGVLGAGGIAGYEADKHMHGDRNTYDQSADPTRSTYDQPSGPTRSTYDQSSVPAAGYETNKHAQNQSGYDEPKQKHNVLHKDPPKNHPASPYYESDKQQTTQPSNYNRPVATNTEPGAKLAPGEQIGDTTSGSHRGAETAAGIGAVGGGVYGSEKMYERHADHDPNTITSGHGQSDNLSPPQDDTHRSSSIVVEPRTGLPMDLEKGREGSHGTDSLPGGHSWEQARREL